MKLKEYKEEYHIPINACLNVTNNCCLKCKYCVTGDTKILMANGHQKNINEIQEGDLIFAFQEQADKGLHHKIKFATVTKVMSRKVNEILKITMQDGKQIQITKNHKVLNGRKKWTEAKNLRQTTGQIKSIGYIPKEEDFADIWNKDYIKGYFLGTWLTDGSHEHYQYSYGQVFNIRLAIKDTEIIDRMKRYCDILNFDYTTRLFKISEKENLYTEAIFSDKRKSFDYINKLEKEVKNNYNIFIKNENFLRGFMAACYDAEGHIDKNGYIISISSSNNFVLNLWEAGLKYFNFNFKRDGGKIEVNLPVFRSRLLTNNNKYPGAEQFRFFTLTNPAVKRKTFLAYENSCILFNNKIKKIEEITGDFIVYNLETSEHTYIANGLAVHNCFVNQNIENMSLTTAVNAVKFLYKNLERQRELYNNPKLKGAINFFGGEPLLRYYDIIEPLVLIVEKDYPDCFNFGVTTNGVLLDKEKIDFLYEHNIIPLLSMDGDKETQDYNRPCKNGDSSFDLIVKNIPYLLEKFPNTVFRMTIYEDTCDKLFDNILFAEAQGFKYFFAIPDTRHNFSEKKLNKLGIELEKFYTYMAGSLIQGIKPIQSSFIKNMFILALKEPSLEIKDLDNLMPRDIFRCGLGTTSISISPDGNIYGCQEQVTNDKNIFYIGDIYNGISLERHSKLLSEFRQIAQIIGENPEKCVDCNYKPFCYEVECPSMAKQRFDNFFVVPETLCFWRNKLIELSKKILQIYHPNIEKYLSEIIEEEKRYELYYSRNNIS